MIAAKHAATALLFLLVFLGAWGCSSPEGDAPSAAEPLEADETAEDDPAPATDTDTDTEDKADKPLRTATVEIYFAGIPVDVLFALLRFEVNRVYAAMTLALLAATYY